MASRLCRILTSVQKYSHRSLVSTSSSITHGSCIPPPSIEGVQASLSSLQLNASPATAHIRSEYKLPSFNHQQKTTKMDPLSNKEYELPTFSSCVLEKFTPSTATIVPIEDPHSIMDRYGEDAVRIHCMPSMYMIRRLKMNKHRLKKIRKKNLFLDRKLARIKKAKKEAEMLAFESTCRKKGEDFNAEKFIDDKLKEAREAGWHIDIWQEYRQKKSQQPN